MKGRNIFMHDFALFSQCLKGIRPELWRG